MKSFNIMRGRMKSTPTAMSACWGNAVAMKYLCHKSGILIPLTAQMLTVSRLHNFFVTDYECGEDLEEFETCYKDIYRDYDSTDISTAKSIFKIILEAWVYGHKTIYTKAHYRPLLLRILQLVSQQKVLNFLLPGFPKKSSNREEKVLGIHADFAECLALRTIIETARQIEDIYSNGVLITIMVDPSTSEDPFNEVSNDNFFDYFDDMKEMIRDVGAEDIIKHVSVAPPTNFQEQYNTKEDYIRLSIHHHHPRSEKYPIDLFKRYDCNNNVLRAPWSHAVMFDSMRGQFVIDHKCHLLSTSSSSSPVFVANLNGRPWILLKIQYSQYGERHVLNEDYIEITMIRNGTGMIIENRSGRQLKSNIFHPDCWTLLIKEFGVIILKGFNKFHDECEIADFYSSYGGLGLIQWEYGSLRNSLSYRKESSDITKGSKESLFHWDLMVPPPYMGISQSSYSYEESTCRELMLYCRSNINKTGATKFIDAHTAIFALNGSKKERWRNTVLVYGINPNNRKSQNIFAYNICGGSFEYPLIQHCPWTDKDVFRWAEMCEDDSDHKQTYTIKTGSETQLSPDELELEIKRLLLEDRFTFEHIYSEHDQVFVNNYTILHSTKGFEFDSELWKLHLVPPSNNIPDHFQNI